MSTLFDQINQEIKAAMLAKDKIKLEAVRAVKKEFLEAKTAPGANDELSDQQAIKIITKMVKQRKDAATIYQQQSRPDLAQTELDQVAVLEQYLPQQLSAEELKAEILQIIQQTGATSAKEMGKVMGVASQSLSGKAEGRAISEMVKQLLA